MKMKSPCLQQAKEALEALDAGKIVGAYGDSFLFEDVPSGERITDKASLRVYFDALFGLPEVAFSDILVHEADTFACIEWTWSGTARSSGKPYRVRGCSAIELRGGKIVRESIYYDPREPLA